MDWGRKCLPELLAVGDVEDEMYFCARVCVCQRVTDAGSAAVEMLFHLSCFPITTLQPE